MSDFVEGPLSFDRECMPSDLVSFLATAGAFHRDTTNLAYMGPA